MINNCAFCSKKIFKWNGSWYFIGLYNDTWLLGKTKTMRNFICLYSHVKFNRFFHYVLQYFIILNWKLKLTKLTWISSRLIDNVKSYEMKCTDLNLISREIKVNLKDFGCTLIFTHYRSDCQSYFISHLTKLSVIIISPYQMVLFWFMLSFLHTDWTTYLPCLFATDKASMIIVSAKHYLKQCVWFQ